jgi:hypothetical protein
MSEPAEGKLPSLETLRALTESMDLAIPDADLERLREEVAALRRHAARLRRIPFDTSWLLGYDKPR